MEDITTWQLQRGNPRGFGNPAERRRPKAVAVTHQRRDPESLPPLTECHSGCWRIVVDPERDPGQDGNQDRWHVRLQDEVANVSLQPEAQGQPRIGTCEGEIDEAHMGPVQEGLKSFLTLPSKTKHGNIDGKCVWIVVYIRAVRDTLCFCFSFHGNPVNMGWLYCYGNKYPL